MEARTIPRLVIAGVASGVGKTTVMVGLTAALRARGLKVAVFKCGPDYLDPTYHRRAAGVVSQNLDGWMMGRDAVIGTFARASRDADIALIEGVMGLFDGASPTGEEGSTAQVAKWLGAPVLLVVDASGMARTLAAVAAGFRSFDPDLKLAGVLANRVGSRGHLDILREAGADPPVRGGLPSQPELSFPERHLGLRTADDAAVPDSHLRGWAETAASWIDIDALLAAAREVPELAAEPGKPPNAPPRCRIGIAMDDAFHFYYEDNVRRLEALGAEMVPFSPMRDAALPDVDGLYIGGGYPEVHAAELSRNGAMRSAIARMAERGTPIYAECGGLMYLASAIRTIDGASHPMVGIFPGEAVMHERLQALGYVEVEVRERSILGAAGLRFRGHQFRYSELVGMEGPIDRIYSVRRRRGGSTEIEGYRRGGVLGSYVHSHWASNPLAAQGLVDACAEHRKRMS